MAKFHVGEVATFIGTPSNCTPMALKIVGEDVEVVALPGRHGTLLVENHYKVSHPSGGIFYVLEECLRKKRPPQESDDIRETREKGAPSFNQMLEDLKKVEVVG